MRQILLRGLPGSGKSTLAKHLRERCKNVAYLSSGSLLREYFANKPPEASRGMDKGQLAESDLVIQLMHAAYTKLDDASTSVLIDGFPRKLSELNRWTELTTNPDFVIICECDEDVRMRRLLGRRICKSCGTGYNMHQDAGNSVINTRISGRCDHCNTVLVLRQDDTAEVIATRTIIHKETEAPVRLMIEQILAPNRILHADMTNGPRIELLTKLINAISSS